MSEETLKIAVVGDLHVNEYRRGAYRDLFTEASRQAELLVLSGDLTDSGLPEEAEILARDLAACTVPILAVLGNHDTHLGYAGDLYRIFRGVGVTFLERETFTFRGVGFAGVIGFDGGFEAPGSAFGVVQAQEPPAEAPAELLRLETGLRSLDTERNVAVLHFAPVVDTVIGEPLHLYHFLGSPRLAETIDRFPVKLIVHGHVHHGSFEGRTPGGIPVYNCALPVLRKRDPAAWFALFEV